MPVSGSTYPSSNTHQSLVNLGGLTGKPVGTSVASQSTRRIRSSIIAGCILRKRQISRDGARKAAVLELENAQRR